MRCLPLTTTPVPTFLLVVDGSTSRDPADGELDALDALDALGLPAATIFRRATYEDLAHIRERAPVDTMLGRPAAGLAAIVASLDGPALALAVDDLGRLTALVVVVDRADLDLSVPDLAAA